MNKEEMLELLNKLKDGINFDTLDNEARLRQIKNINKQITEMELQIHELESRDDDYYLKKVEENNSIEQAPIEDLKEQINLINIQIEATKLEIEKLNEQNAEIDKQISQFEKQKSDFENTHLESNEKGSEISSNFKEINEKLEEARRKIESNEKIVSTNNNLLLLKNQELEYINEKIESNENAISKIDNDTKIAQEKEKTAKAIKIAYILKDNLETNKRALEINFEQQLNGMINELNNGTMTVEEVNYEMSLYKDGLFKEYLNLDKQKRDVETAFIREDIYEYENLIKDLEEKLADENNYKYKETTKKNMIANALKIKRLEQNEKVMFYEGYRKDYEDITKMYEEDRKNLLEELNDEKTSEEDKVQIKEKLKELDVTISQGKELTNDYSKYKVMFDNLKKRAYSDEIDRSEIRLDKNKLSNYKSVLNSLKNRENYLNADIEEILGKFEDPVSKTNDEAQNIEAKEEIEKEPQQFEIKVVKRSLKEKLKNNMKKVAVAVITAMTLMVAAAPSIQMNNNEIPNVDETTIENMIDEKAVGNMSEEEAIRQVEDELKDQVQKEISLSNKITVNEGAEIYNNQYDAVNKTNPFNPLYERNMERNIIGITIKMPDGSFKFVQDDDSVKKFVDEGGLVSACLTGENNQAEGFWNIDDITIVNQLEQEMGGMSR